MLDGHAHVVGSLMRPDYLRRAREQRAAGELTPSEFKRLEDQAVDEAIELQQRAGIAIVNDGELRRNHFSAPIAEAISGIEPVSGFVRRWHTADGVQEQEIPFAITQPIRRTRSVVAEEFAYARARADRPVKVTLPSPTMALYLWSKDHSTTAYPDPFALVADAADVVKAEIRELVAMGCEHIQIDAPELTLHVDPTTRAWQAEAGVPTERMLTEGLDSINDALDVQGVRRSLHLCRGNGSNERWLAAGGYDEIAKALFERTPNVDRFFLEYDDARIVGSFAPLADAPADKEIVLGLVTTKSPAIETPDELRERIDDASEHFPREQLGLSTQCGFASRGEATPMTPEEQEAKLRLVGDVAAAAWQ